MTLDEVRIGEEVQISGYRFWNSNCRFKLLALGLTKDVKVKIVNIAPLGDPIEILVRGYHLSIRKNEAKMIKVREIE